MSYSRHKRPYRYDSRENGYYRHRRRRYSPSYRSRRYSSDERRYHEPYYKKRRKYYYSRSRSSSRTPSRSRERSRETHNYYDDKDGHYLFVLGESLTDRYKILNFMGEGTFAKVVECWDRKEKKYVAIKIVRAIEKYVEAAEIEVDILKDVNKRSENKDSGCIQLLDSFSFRGHMCLVFPNYGLSLYDFLRKNNYRGFLLHHVRDFARNLLKAVAFLHDMKLIHTDLKPENILLKNSDYYEMENGYMVPKCTDTCVIDFGSATYDDQHHTSIISTRHYRAPEVILGLGWSYPADIWSVGCIIVELLTGDAMFQTHENREHLAMMEKILGTLPKSMTLKASTQKYFRPDGSLAWPEIASSSKSISIVNKLKPLRELCNADKDEEHKLFYDLCKKLLVYEPEKRLTAKQALEHPFLKIQKEQYSNGNSSKK